MNSDMNYTLKTPEPGWAVDYLPRYEDEVRSSGRIETVVDEGEVDGLENFTITTTKGAVLRIVVLRPESPMDDEEQRCFTLLDWHRAQLGVFDEEETESVKRGILKRVAAGIWSQVKERPFVILGLIVLGTGIVLLLLGHGKLGEAFIDLGVKIFLTFGALVRNILASAPAILHQASDWVEPGYFMSRWTA